MGPVFSVQLVKNIVKSERFCNSVRILGSFKVRGMEKNINDGENGETYRVKKISVRKGWAIDQIKFEYDDNKTWAHGIDGGREDNRKLIMTPGEYLVRVTHETLKQRWYAGSSVEFETNKGRIITFNPYLKTGLKDHEVTMKAKDGMEIVMLNIKHGKLIDVKQQAVPTMEICPAP